MNRICLLFFILAAFSISAQKQYFDENWKTTTKEKASFYRIVTKSAENYSVNDYYIDGVLQFSGTSSVATEPLQLEGKATWYNHNGKPASEAEFLHHKPHGPKTEYYCNGARKSVINYRNGVEEGLQQQFFPSGAIKREQTIVNGSYTGKFVEYATETAKKTEANFRNGKVDGRYAFYRGDNQSPEALGNAVNGIQDGECTNYTYDGDLLYRYTVKNGLLDGDYFRYAPDGKPTIVGKFKAGKVISFKVLSQRWNDSEFSSELQLINGLESRKIYRDGALVGESFYKAGKRTGIWKFYTYDGKKPFATIDYTQAVCEDSEPEVQSAPEELSPNFRLSPRFSLDSDMMNANGCEGVEKKYLVEGTEGRDSHPFFYMKRDTAESKEAIRYSKAETIQKGENSMSMILSGTLQKDLDYSEPASSKEFIERNNCKSAEIGAYPEMVTCEKAFGPTVYKLYFSENVENLSALHASVEPADNEIYFFYQKYPDGIVRAGAPTRTRYMAFRISEVIKEALNEKIMDYIIMCGRLETEVFTADTFYGSTAFDAFEKEYRLKVK